MTAWALGLFALEDQGLEGRAALLAGEIEQWHDNGAFKGQWCFLRIVSLARRRTCFSSSVSPPIPTRLTLARMSSS